MATLNQTIVQRLARALAVLLALALAPPARAAKDPAAEIAALQAKRMALMAEAKMRDVVPVTREILAKTREAYPKDPEKLIAALVDLSYAQQGVADFPGARRSVEEALALSERANGQKHPQTVALLEQLGGIAFAHWDVDGVKHAYGRALAIREELEGKSPMYATYLGIYASMLVAMRLYGEAEPAFLEAIRILEQHKGPEAGELIGPLLSLGQMYWLTGYRAQSLELNRRALGLQEKQYGAESEYVAPLLQFIVMQLTREGDLEAARPYLERAERIHRRQLEIARAKPSPDDDAVASALHQIAELRMQAHRYAEARDLFQESIGVTSTKYGPKHYRLRAPLQRLGEALRLLRAYDAAVEVLRRLGAIEREQSGDTVYSGASAVLGMVLREAGRHDEAIREFDKLLEYSIAAYGDRHMLAGTLHEALGGIHLAKGAVDRALESFEAGRQVLDAQEDAIFSAGDEVTSRGLLHSTAYRLHLYASLHLDHAFQNPRALGLALDTLFRRKGRDLDAVSQQMAAMRKQLGPKERELLDQLQALRAQIAKLGLQGASGSAQEAHARELARLDGEARQVERELRQASLAYRVRQPQVTVAAIQKALPPDSALIELVRYRPFLPTAPQEALLGDKHRFAAYILRPGVAPVAVGLGEEDPIERSIQTFRAALADPDRADVNALGRDLFNRVMRPLLPALGNARHLLLSPDGGLNLVPFAALTDEKGEPLVKRFTMTYLTSGRDLLRFSARFDPKQGAVILADPAFQGGDGAPAKGRGRRSAVFRGVSWSPLPGTAEEAAALKAQMSDALLLTREAATETALKGLHGPRVLHVATHGFFLPSDREERPEGPGRGTAAQAEEGGAENPLLRSGLVLAGANALSSGEEDGVLTALEASGLDLWGTRLVVLSACETGVGETRAEQGVYGLRRALVIAGAESMLMSLWQVDDEATRDLMIAYYQELAAGAGRAEALRRVQVRMQGSGRFAHPYYWASFIPVGQWSPLD